MIVMEFVFNDVISCGRNFSTFSCADVKIQHAICGFDILQRSFSSAKLVCWSFVRSIRLSASYKFSKVFTRVFLLMIQCRRCDFCSVVSSQVISLRIPCSARLLRSFDGIVRIKGHHCARFDRLNVPKILFIWFASNGPVPTVCSSLVVNALCRLAPCPVIGLRRLAPCPVIGLRLAPPRLALPAAVRCATPGIRSCFRVQLTFPG